MNHELAIDVTYADTLKLIRSTVHRFIRHHKLYRESDFDELFSRANYYWVVAFYKYDATTQWSTWMTTQIWCGLMHEARRDNRYYTRKGDGDTRVIQSKCMLDELPFDVWEDMSDEGRELWDMFRETAVDLERVYRESVRKNSTRVLFRYLLNLGWSRGAIFRAIRDIGTVLGDPKPCNEPT